MNRSQAASPILSGAMRWPLVILLAAMLAVASCQGGSPPELTLTLLSTNDFHGALDPPSKDPETGRALGGAAVLAAAIAREKATNPEGTLLLDAGDSFHGTVFSYLSEGRAIIDFMNLVGYDAAAIGNHEFDWGIPVLRERIAQAEFPFLVANIVEKATGEAPSWAVPYHIFERRGLRVAVIGLIATDTPETTLPQMVEGLEFRDPAPVANRWIAELVPAQADIAVLLCHLGIWHDPDEDVVFGDLVDMAQRVRGVAALVAGHTHQVFADEIHGIPAVEAGDRGRFLGRIDLVFDHAKRQVIAGEARIVDVVAASPPPDSAVAELVNRYRVEADEAIQEVIGEAATLIERDRSAECPIGNLLVDAIRHLTGATFVFQNPLGVRASLEAGPITQEEIYLVMPFDNTIVMVRMTGKEIKVLLEQAVDRVGLLYVSGLRYAIDPARPSGSRITISPPLEDGRTYEVAINNFLAQGGDGLKILAHRPEARDTGVLLRDALTNWIREETRKGRKITARVDGRILIKP